MFLASVFPMEVAVGVREMVVRKVLKARPSFASFMEAVGVASILDVLKALKAVLTTA